MAACKRDNAKPGVHSKRSFKSPAHFFTFLDYQIGIFSMSESENDLLMWAHYADDHAGFVFELDPQKLGFPGVNILDLACPGLVKIIYSDSRPVMPWAGKLTDPALFITKIKHWEYEQEWRGFRRLSDCETKLQNGNLTIHLFSLPPGCIRRVIIGCRMSVNYRERVLAAAKCISVPVQASKPDFGKFKLIYF